ncbi:MAG: phage tail assembly chaperone [Ignavibacterium sp.]
MELYRKNKKLIVIHPPHTIEIDESGLEKDYVAQVERIIQDLERQSKLAPDENGNLVELQEEQLVPDVWTRFKWLREKRDEALLKTDYTQLPDAPTREQEKYRIIRQRLRDLPATVDIDLILSKEDVDKIIQSVFDSVNLQTR